VGRKRSVAFLNSKPKARQIANPRLLHRGGRQAWRTDHVAGGENSQDADGEAVVQPDTQPPASTGLLDLHASA
jgi:hypothetical protein